jgi:hypothetical protein
MGGIGFIFSALTVIVLFVPSPLTFMVFVTYPISILLRGFSWFSLGRRVRNRIFAITSLFVVVLGACVYLFAIGVGGHLSQSPLMLIGAWATYSITELISYYTLSSRLGIRSFKLAMISFVGIILLTMIVSRAPRLDLDVLVWPWYHLGMLSLLISSLTASLSFFRLRKMALSIPIA